MAKKANDVDYESLLKKKKMPILTLDNRWHQLFPPSTKSLYIKKLEDDLNQLMKQQGKVVNELKDLKKLKQRLMDEIMNNMAEMTNANESRRQKKLGHSQRLIIEINEKIENLEDEVYHIPKRIQEANNELLLASIEDCYRRMKENEKELQDIADWIDTTRNELKEKIVMKQEKEEMNTQIYSYMHDLIGPDFIEVFDSEHED